MVCEPSFRKSSIESRIFVAYWTTTVVTITRRATVLAPSDTFTIIVLWVTSNCFETVGKSKSIEASSCFCGGPCDLAIEEFCFFARRVLFLLVLVDAREKDSLGSGVLATTMFCSPSGSMTSQTEGATVAVTVSEPRADAPDSPFCICD
jgi:hypothetical protein